MNPDPCYYFLKDEVKPYCTERMITFANRVTHVPCVPEHCAQSQPKFKEGPCLPYDSEKQAEQNQEDLSDFEGIEIPVWESPIGFFLGE